MSEKSNESDGKEIVVDDMMMEDETTTEHPYIEKDDDDLAQDALDATEEESTEESTEDETTEEGTTEDEEEQTEEGKVDPKDAKIGEFRRKNRDLELDNAKLQGQLEARKELQKAEVEEVVKSPMEIAEEAYIKEYDELPAEGIPMTTKLYNEQRKFDADQDAKAVPAKPSGGNTQLEVAIDHFQQGEFSEEKAGKGRDFETVLNAAEPLFTNGEILDLKEYTAKNGTVAGLRKSYKVGVKKLEAAGHFKAAKPKGPKPKAQKPKLNSNAVDDLMSEEDDTYSADSESGDVGRLASFLADTLT